MKLTRTATLATALALGLAAAAEAQDVVRLRNGTEVKAKVTAMTSQSITYSEGAGKVSTAKKEDVAGVELGDKPPSMAKADAAMAASQYDKAINHYAPARHSKAARSCLSFAACSSSCVRAVRAFAASTSRWTLERAWAALTASSPFRATSIACAWVWRIWG